MHGSTRRVSDGLEPPPPVSATGRTHRTSVAAMTVALIARVQGADPLAPARPVRQPPATRRRASPGTCSTRNDAMPRRSEPDSDRPRPARHRTSPLGPGEPSSTTARPAAAAPPGPWSCGLLPTRWNHGPSASHLPRASPIANSLSQPGPRLRTRTRHLPHSPRSGRIRVGSQPSCTNAAG